MHAFWTNGFRGVSFDQLVDETGASRHSLYQEFGDKRRLLARALEHYENTVLRELFKELRQDDASLEAIERFFRRMSRVARPGSRRGPGCLMCNSHIELESDVEIRKQIESFFRRLQRVFLESLERAKRMGDLDHDANPLDLSRFLVGLVRGVSANARSRSSDADYTAYVEVSMSILRR